MPSRKRTILHTIDTTGPGGAETVFIDLLTRLPRDRYRSIVTIRGKGWVYEELQRQGFEPVLIDAKGSFNIRYLTALARLIRQEKVDVVQSHLLGANVYCSLVGLLTGTPVVTTFHGGVDIGENERFKALKFAAINRGAFQVVAVSHNLRGELLARTPLRADKTTVIYNGIDTQAAARPTSQALRERFGWSDDEIIIGSLGNIRRAKSYDILLRAAARACRQSRQSLRFVIAGQGKGHLYEELLELRSELGLEDRVHFLGFIQDPQEFLSNLDLFVLSSTSEGFSIATIQAMAAKLPVLVTRSGGPEEIVTHLENGWMVDAGDAGALADGIQQLLDDAPLRERLANSGREHAIGTFDVVQMIRSYAAIYERAVNRDRPDTV